MLAAAASMSCAWAAEPTGETFAHTCAACHGTNGALAAEAFPPLAGMEKSTMTRVMQEFRDLKRPSSIMSHIAQGYNDAEIERIAEYFASLPASGNDSIAYDKLGNFREGK